MFLSSRDAQRNSSIRLLLNYTRNFSPWRSDNGTWKCGRSDLFCLPWCTGGHAPGWQDVQPHDPQVQDAANHVVKSRQQKSNSLFPYELQEIVHAKAEAMDSFEPYGNGTNGSNGENGANVENDANGETKADGNGAEHALLPHPLLSYKMLFHCVFK